MNRDVSKAVLPLLAVLVLGGCASTRSDGPVRVETVTVNIDRPIPCPALAALGPEPLYPDTDEELATAPSVGILARLYRIGRALRQQRLEEYQTARSACEALEE